MESDKTRNRCQIISDLHSPKFVAVLFFKKLSNLHFFIYLGFYLLYYSEFGIFVEVMSRLSEVLVYKNRIILLDIFLWLFILMFSGVSALPMYCRWHFLHSNR